EAAESGPATEAPRSKQTRVVEGRRSRRITGPLWAAAGPSGCGQRAPHQHAREVDGAGEQPMRDALAAVAGPNADAPDAPDVEVVHVRDLAVAREGRIRTPRDRRPADDRR